MALSDARDYVLAVESNKQEALEVAGLAAQKLETRQTTLIDLVQSLGEYINDGDDKIRARAISYLTAVISALSPKYLSRQQIQVLTQFLCDRIEDGGAIDGLSKLQSLDRFTNEMAQTVVRAIFEHFRDLQTRNQAVRYRVLQLLSEVMDHHRKAVRDMSDEFIVGITDLVAGEKDPRNLVLVFSMLRVVMIEWDITRHTETLFDAVYAYFPITFRPPPNDPYGITAQDLKDKLRDCLASTPFLGPYTFPSLLDRLDSTSNTVKNDVLQALTACAENYGSGTMALYAITLWDAVKFEVLQAQEPELAQEALRLLKEIAACLSTSANTSDTTSSLLQYLKPIEKECLEHLQEPASRQANASGDILKAVSSASVPAFEIVIQSIGPALLTILQSVDGIIQQRAVLEVANQLFEAAVEVYGSWTSLRNKNPEGRPNLLHELKDKIIAIYSQALVGTVKQEVSLRLTAANGLLLISKVKGLLQDEEIGLFVQYFNDIVLTEESYGRDELKQKAMTALAEISQFKPRLISDITFPAFMARLPDTEEDAARSTDYHSVLDGLAEISVEKELLDTLMRRLLNKLDLLLQADWQGPFSYACAILGTVYFVLDRAVTTQNISLDPYYDRIVVGFCRKATEARGGPLTNENVLYVLGRVINLILRNSSPDRVQQAADNVYLLYRGQKDAEIRLSALMDPPTLTFLSTWILAALPRDTSSRVLEQGQILHHIEDLVQFGSYSKNNSIAQSTLLQVALFVNKHVASTDLEHIDNILLQRFAALRHSPNETFPFRRENQRLDFDIRLCFLLIKALILRLAPKTNQYLADLVGLLDSSQYPTDVSTLSAKRFATLLSPDDVLSKTNFVQIRLLTPQRVVQTLTPLISNKFRESRSPAEKENYLIALSGILAGVPSDIVMPELPMLLPLLLQSLDLSDQTVKMATLETLAVVIANNPTALEESGHVPALVKRLLTTATIPKQSVTSNLPRTRRLATRCLTLMPKHFTGSASRPNPLLNLKREVLHGLTVVLDDPKRDVRKEAVDAKGAWIRSVDDPDEDEDE